MPVVFDFDKLSTMDNDHIENLINEMTAEELLIHINAGRARAMNPTFEPSEQEQRAALLMVRKFRATRESKNRTAKAEKAATAPSLSDLMSGL